jgi:hypothetical protein
MAEILHNQVVLAIQHPLRLAGSDWLQKNSFDRFHFN